MDHDHFLHRQKVALLWGVTGLGTMTYAFVQSFSYLSSYIRSNGAPPVIIFDNGALWFFSIFLSLGIVPGLLAIIGRNAFANWIMVILGGLLVIGNTLGSIFDGIRDGGYITATAVIAITLPGTFALRASRQLLRGSFSASEPSE